jgi:hypothetical protein
MVVVIDFNQIKMAQHFSVKLSATKFHQNRFVRFLFSHVHKKETDRGF